VPPFDPGFRPDVPTTPRRGVPRPLRSAFAVSHDLDGLLLLEPCGVFRSHTPMRFRFPSPRGRPVRRVRRPADPDAGGGLLARKAPGWPPSWLDRTFPPSFACAVNRCSDRRGGRSSSGSPAFASPLARQPPACADVRPLAPPDWFPAPATAAANRHGPSVSAPLQGLPLSREFDHWPRVTATGDRSRRDRAPRSTRERELPETRLRHQPLTLSGLRPVASAGWAVAARPPHPEGCLG
jgi:hypothetical protein